MRMPGFTAESSLYTRYGTFRSQGLVSAGGIAIIPQLMPIGGRLGGLGDNCYWTGEDIVCYGGEAGTGTSGEAGTDTSGGGVITTPANCQGNIGLPCFCNNRKKPNCTASAQADCYCHA